MSSDKAASAKKRTGLLAKIITAAIVAVLTILITGDHFLSIGQIKELELKSIDQKFTNRGAVPFKDSTSDVIILEITRNTFESMPDEYKKWPFPREFFARVIHNLNEAGVKAIGIDLLMENPLTFSAEDDSTLIKAIQEKHNVVVSGKTFDENVQVSENVQATVTRENENYGSFLFPVDSSIGIVQVIADNDGVHRRYLPFAYSETSQRSIPTFSFAVLNKWFGLKPLQLSDREPGYFKLAGHEIPRYDKISMLVNIYGPSGKFPRVDFADVLDDSSFNTKEEIELGEPVNMWDDPVSGILHDGRFKDKIVLIGSTLEEDRDVVQVAFSSDETSGSNTLYGVEFHANVIQNVIDNNYIERFPEWGEILLIIVFVFISFFISSGLREIKFRIGWLLEIASVLVIFLLVFGIFEISNYLFNSQKLLLSYVGIDVGIFLGYISSTALHFILERRQKTQIKGMFSQYVDKSMVDQLIADPEKLRLGGEKKYLTVFFSDIAGFSTFSETMDPEDLVKFLNQYLSAMTDVVMANHGTLDKYIGDAVMAFWGAPIPLENHAQLACRTALQQQKIMNELRKGWEAEGKPLIQMRIGINTGDMVVGNVGGSQRFDYTLMGDNVNLASRLEGANKAYGTFIMIADSTYELVKNEFVTRELDLLVVKGKTHPVKVYELIADANEHLPESRIKCVKLYTEAMEKYRNRDFQDAIKGFTEALNIDPGDGPSKVYIERSKLYLETPPEEDWDGVFKLTTK